MFNLLQSLIFLKKILFSSNVPCRFRAIYSGRCHLVTTRTLIRKRMIQHWRLLGLIYRWFMWAPKPLTLLIDPLDSSVWFLFSFCFHIFFSVFYFIFFKFSFSLAAIRRFISVSPDQVCPIRRRRDKNVLVCFVCFLGLVFLFSFVSRWSFQNFVQNFWLFSCSRRPPDENAHKLVANWVTFRRWAAPHPSVLLAVVWSLDVVSFFGVDN